MDLQGEHHSRFVSEAAIGIEEKSIFAALDAIETDLRFMTRVRSKHSLKEAAVVFITSIENDFAASNESALDCPGRSVGCIRLYASDAISNISSIQWVGVPVTIGFPV